MSDVSVIGYTDETTGARAFKKELERFITTGPKASLSRAVEHKLQDGLGGTTARELQTPRASS